MNENINYFIEKNRSTSSSYHLRIGMEWRKFGEPKKLQSPLLYSAFEYRCSIERYLFEIYYLMSHTVGFSMKEERIANKFSNLKKEILRISGGKDKLKSKLIFNNVLLQIEKNRKVAVFDIDYMNKLWSKLSDYCHKQLKPDATWHSLGDKWVEKGYDLLNEVEKYMWNIIVLTPKGWLNEQSIPSETYNAREDFINGKIDESTLRTRLDLIKPILKQRDLSKKLKLI